jgi:site-specific DNA-methyltransferase (adenine-specific)
VELFPDTKSGKLNTASITAANLTYGTRPKELSTQFDYADSGSAARFFYCAKASKKDRNEGLDDFAGKEVGTKGNGLARTCASCGASTLQGCECPDRTYVNPTRANHHPTVKPTDLMRYLVRMITPPNGTVLDPFMGSGSTGKAAVLERFSFIGIDQSADYLEIATARIKHAQEQIEGQLL